jgi:hypothetical protein
MSSRKQTSQTGSTTIKASTCLKLRTGQRKMFEKKEASENAPEFCRIELRVEER